MNSVLRDEKPVLSREVVRGLDSFHQAAAAALAECGYIVITEVAEHA